MKKLSKKYALGLGIVFLASTAYAAENILTDLIVQGSSCIGMDCSTSESFGFDTLRLKENNLRIKFDDTSNSASFAANDWELTANDSANGGSNRFSITDITNNQSIFTVEAKAGNNALYVKEGGNVGLSTSTPATHFHILDGNTPTIRLQQNNSQGWGTGTWDIGGNETNFLLEILNKAMFILSKSYQTRQHTSYLLDQTVLQ